MKHLNLPYGVKWILRVIVSSLFAVLWAWMAYPSAYCQNFFEIIIPNSQTVMADIGILFAGIYLAVKLHPVIANNVLRYLFIPPQALAISMLFFFGYYAFEIIYPNCSNVFKTYHKAGLNMEALQLHYMDNKFDFWWMITGRLLMPLFIILIPIQLLEWVTMFKDHKLYRSLFVEGRGGGSKWAGSFTFRKHKGKICYTQNNDKLILGRALFADDPKKPIIAMEDQSHGISAGLTGSGKETTVILNNLCQYSSSAFVIDIKGSIAEQTFRSRSSKPWLVQNNALGKTWRYKKGDARAYVLDPFKETKNLPLFNYNVLSEIDINSDRARELLFAITDACVIPEPKDVHFSEFTKMFIAGLIAHVLSKFPKEQQHLCTVFDILNGIDPELKFADPTRFEDLLIEMNKNTCCGGLVQSAAVKMMEVGDREKGSYMSTAARSLMWCSDLAMRKQLTSSDFAFSEFHKRTTTVYVVLPEALMSTQLRWLRVLTSLTVILTRKEIEDKRKSTLILLDELPRLAGIDVIRKGFAFYRNQGFRLWGFVQNISQIRELFSEDYDAILGNSTVQVFGVNSQHTAEYVAGMVGERVIKRKNKNKEVTEEIKPLLTPAEVRIRLTKNANECIVFPTDGGYPMRLERCSFKPLKINGKRFFEFSPFAFKGCFENY